MGAVLPSLESFVPLLGPVDGKLGVDFERGLLVDGRRPDPDAVHDIAISENAAEILGVGVGDELAYDGLTPAEFDMCLAGESDPPPECEALFGRTDGPIPITLDVVGIVRTGTDVTGIANDFAVITVTPGFYEHYHGRIGEEANLVPVRLREGGRRNSSRASSTRSFPTALMRFTSSTVAEASVTRPTRWPSGSWCSRSSC